MRGGTKTRVLSVRNSLPIILVLVALALSSASGAGTPSAHAVSSPLAATVPRAATVLSGHSAFSPEGLRPLPLNSSTGYFANTSGFAVPSFADQGCAQSVSGGSFTDVTNTCTPIAIDPTLMTLGDGDTGISYEVNTNHTGSTCLGAASSVRTAIGFAVSTTGGTSFGTPTILANTTCSYLQAIEPSFASTGNFVDGTFIEENQSLTDPGAYGTGVGRIGDALAFVNSSTDGTSFNAPITINRTGNLAHPEIAAFGDSIYIVYENLVPDNATYVCSGGPFLYGGCVYTTTIRVYFVDSLDGGHTWSTPTALPGLNATASYFSLNPSITVNKTGTVAVAYFTNLTCAQYYGGGCMDTALDLIAITSTTNGTSWSKLSTVAHEVGVSDEYDGTDYETPPSQWLPQTQVIFNPAGTAIYLTWSGLYNKSLAYVYDQWCCGGIFFASGPTSLASAWAVSRVSTTFNWSTNYDDMFNPAVGDVGGTIYVAYTWNNESECTPCLANQYTTASFNERLRWSTDGGTTWQGLSVLQIAKMAPGCTTLCAAAQFAGYSASVGSSSRAAPLVAYALPGQTVNSIQSASNFTWFNATAPTNLSVSFPYTGATVTVNLTEAGLPSGDTWTFDFEGSTISVVGASTSLTGVPMCQPVLLYPNTVDGGYGQQFQPNSTDVGSAIFCNNATVVFNYTETWQLLLFVNPTVSVDMGLSWTAGGFTNSYLSEWYCAPACTTFHQWCINGFCGPTESPAYYPNGTRILIASETYFTAFVNYWNGSGIGTYTGPGLDANITIDGPINETGWAGAFGTFNETFAAPTLPSTSTYHFTFDGGNYSGLASASSVVPSVVNGAYDATNIWATSGTAGWEYFGVPIPGNPIVVPAELLVNFTFAFVDVGGPVGVIAFHATGLTGGTVWRFEFNGTVYSSTTPWINVTEHSGTFPVAAYPVVAANGTAGYTPSAVGSTWSVTEGMVYDISFTSAYRVVATASTGGSISGTGHGTLWVAAGTVASFHATPGTGYAFNNWVGVGTGSYSGSNPYANVTVNAPMTESAIFFSVRPAHLNLTFTESGLAPGTWWTVFLSGSGYSSDLSSLIVGNLLPCGGTGTYTLSVPFAYLNGTTLTRYAPGTYPHTICTSGTTIEPLSFAPQYFLTLEATAGGIGEATIGASTISTSEWVPGATSVLLGAASNPGYDFLGWNGTGPGSYTGPIAATSFLVNNPVTEIAAFAPPVAPPPVRYWLDFHLASPFAPGTVWSVTLGPASYSATADDLNVTGLSGGPYTLAIPRAISPDGLTEYAAVGYSTSIDLLANKTVTLEYSSSYWVSVSASFGGNVVGPGSSWLASGQSVALNESADPGYEFVGWVGTGLGNYTGDAGAGSIRVNGPISEIAEFTLSPPATTTTTGSTIWSSPITWVALAAVGLILGVLLGVLLFGRRPQTPPRDETAPEVPPEPFSSPSMDEPDPPTTEESS